MFRSATNEVKGLAEKLFPEKTGFPRVGELKKAKSPNSWFGLFLFE
jgi:hypothetical protein